MEAAIQTVVKVFLKSSKGKEGLGKKEFQSLVKSQLSNILTGTESNEEVNNMGQGLDSNQDGKVGFEEYMKLVGYLAVTLSEQRGSKKDEPAQNAASGQVAQSAKEEEVPEAAVTAAAEIKPEAEEDKAEAAPEVKVEANASGMVEVKLEAKAEEETQPEAPKVEEVAAAAAAAAAAVAEAAVPVVEVEEEAAKVEETEKAEGTAEAPDVEEDGEKKTEEEGS